MPDSYSLKQNAARAAKKALADGSAPASTYEIKGAKGGFRIAWDTADARERFIESGIADLEAADDAKAATKRSRSAKRWADTTPHGMAGVAPAPVERAEDIDTNEPGDLSPADEKLAEGLRTDSPESVDANAELTREFAGELARNPQSALTKGERELLREVAADVPKAGTQLAKVTDLLKRAEGATIAEIQAVTGWLPHTTRAFISVQVRRKAGLEVTTDKVEGRGRVYRVAA